MKRQKANRPRLSFFRSDKMAQNQPPWYMCIPLYYCICTYFSGIHILAELSAESCALIYENAKMLLKQWTVIQNQADVLIHDCTYYYLAPFFLLFPLKFCCAKISTRTVIILKFYDLSLPFTYYCTIAVFEIAFIRVSVNGSSHVHMSLSFLK